MRALIGCLNSVVLGGKMIFYARADWMFKFNSSGGGK